MSDRDDITIGATAPSIGAAPGDAPREWDVYLRGVRKDDNHPFLSGITRGDSTKAALLGRVEAPTAAQACQKAYPTNLWGWPAKRHHVVTAVPAEQLDAEILAQFPELRASYDAQRAERAARAIAGTRGPALAHRGEDVPVWHEGALLYVGTHREVPTLGVALASAEQAAELAGVFRALWGDAFGVGLSARALYLLERYVDPEAVGRATDAAHAAGQTLGQWVAALVERELGVAPKAGRAGT